MDAVVVWLAALEAAGPAEAEVLHIGADFRHVRLSEFLAVAVRVNGDEFLQRLLLGGGHFRGFHANGIKLFHFPVLGGEDVGGRRFGIDDRLAAFHESGREGAGQVFLGMERTGAFHLVLDGDLAGVRREKGGSDGDRLAIDDSVVEREVMTLEAPCPRAAGFRIAEDGGEIGLVVTELGTLFDLTEKGLQRDHGIDLFQAGIAERGLEKRADEGGLLFIEFLDRNAFTLAGDEAPVLALVGGEGKLRFFRLCFIKRGEEGIRGGCHLRGDVHGFLSEGCDGGEDAYEKKIFHGGCSYVRSHDGLARFVREEISFGSRGC